MKALADRRWRMSRHAVGTLIAGLLFSAMTAAQTEITRATLDNGLRVVIVRNSLAPTATVARRYYETSADQVRAAFAKRIRPDDLVEVVQGPAPK